MKTYFTLIFCLTTAIVTGQTPIEVKVIEHNSSMGKQAAFEVLVPQATSDDAIDLWKKTITPKGKSSKSSKMEKIKDEWLMNGVTIGEISPQPLNVITQISSYSDDIYIRVFMQAEDGFLGSEASSKQHTDAASKYIRDFAVELYREAVEEELKGAEKELKSLEKDFDKLVNDNKKYNSNINEAKQEVIELQGALTNHQKLISESSAQGLTNATATEDMDKLVKSTEKDLKKAEKSQSDYEKKIQENQNDQKDKTSEIEAQKKKVAEVQTKLDNIK